jgi:hypothetical protein
MKNKLHEFVLTKVKLQSLEFSPSFRENKLQEFILTKIKLLELGTTLSDKVVPKYYGTNVLKSILMSALEKLSNN